MKTEPVDE